jgi:hypothetical protein
MEKAKARRLKPGYEILFGDHQYTAQCTYFAKGEVLHVTQNGGVKVRVIDEKPWYGSEGYARRYGCNVVRWVPYHHIIR